MTAAPPAEVESAPATDWMNGARTAQQIVTAQIAAGQTADEIAGKWAAAEATYDDATATPAQREWHDGATHTAGDLIETYRATQAAEAAEVTRDDLGRGHDATEPEAELEAG